jgi:hypothetical protein
MNGNSITVLDKKCKRQILYLRKSSAALRRQTLLEGLVVWDYRLGVVAGARCELKGREPEHG